jgi:hypothetical protein
MADGRDQPNDVVGKRPMASYAPHMSYIVVTDLTARWPQSTFTRTHLIYPYMAKDNTHSRSVGLRTTQLIHVSSLLIKESMSGGYGYYG